MCDLSWVFKTPAAKNRKCVNSQLLFFPPGDCLGDLEMGLESGNHVSTIGGSLADGRLTFCQHHL